MKKFKYVFSGGHTSEKTLFGPIVYGKAENVARKSTGLLCQALSS